MIIMTDPTESGTTAYLVGALVNNPKFAQVPFKSLRLVLGGGMGRIPTLYHEIPRRWGAYVFSDRVDTRLVAPKHGDSSGVRGAAWLWPV